MNKLKDKLTYFLIVLSCLFLVSIGYKIYSYNNIKTNNEYDYVNKSCNIILSDENNNNIKFNDLLNDENADTIYYSELWHEKDTFMPGICIYDNSGNIIFKETTSDYIEYLDKIESIIKK